MRLHRIFFALLLPLAFLLPLRMTAQQQLDTLQVGVRADEQPLAAVLEALGARYGLRFYAPAGALEGIRVTLQREAPLPEMLDRLLAGTGLSHLLYRDQAVVIGDRTILTSDYGADYYRALEQALAAQADTLAGAEAPLVIGDVENLAADGRARLSGQVTDRGSGEPVIGATLYFPRLAEGIATDEEGRYALTLATGEHELEVQSVGYGSLSLQLEVYGDGELPLELALQSTALQEVIVEAQAPDDNVARVVSGLTRLDIRSIQKLPAFMGEVDIIQGLLLQPGVSTVGEGAAGINVRGGNIDQNLIMQDEAFLFNSAHALGFFSTFNSDLVSSVDLYKGIMPAQYGGRLASVLDVEMRNGNFDHFQLRGGLSPVTARLSLEGPVVKDRGSFIAGFRGAFSDWFLQLVPVPEVQQSSASFYDANLRYTHRINDVHTLGLVGYSAWDRFRYADEFGFNYRTNSGQVFLRSALPGGMLSRLSLTYSRYESGEEDLSGADASVLENEVRYLKGKEQLSFQVTDGVAVDAGASVIYYQVDPGRSAPANAESSVFAEALEEERGLESAAFLNAEWSPSAALTLSGGLRYVWYTFLGPQTVYRYAFGPPYEAAAIVDSTLYGSGQRIADYHSLEPRLSARYRFGPASSLKAGYSRTAQFINQITDASSPTPTSLWQLSTPYIEPQRSHNVSLGYFHNFNDNRWETSVEVYYRFIDELFDYRDFADLTLNPHLETELLSGEGRAYGLELSAKRKAGRLNGWVSYTFSRSELQIAGINDGQWYPTNFDQPHNLSVVLNFQFNRRNTLSFNFNYRSGRPLTAPVGSYTLESGLSVPDYSLRNQYRIPDYHRLDVAYTFGQGYNKTRRFKTSWTVSVYNVYGRRNAFSVYFTQQPFNIPKANRLSILGGVFPSLTFNFELL